MSTALQPREPVITQGTAGFASFAEHAAATAAAGCCGISVWMKEYSKIEIFSDAQSALDPHEAVRRAVEATRRVLDEAARSAGS